MEKGKESVPVKQSGVDTTDTGPCPICNSDRYLNPNMILLVGTCFHKMCQSCVNRIFAYGSAPCPVCRTMIKKTDFVKPIFENLFVEKECRVRKRMWKMLLGVPWSMNHLRYSMVESSFNKTLEDFDNDLKAYNDYLEEVEELIFNLVNETDAQVIRNKLEQYQLENAEIIQQNNEKREIENQMINQIMNEEARGYRERLDADIKQQQIEADEKQRRKQELIHELAVSDKPIQEIVQENYKSEHSTTIPGSSEPRGPSLLTRLAQYQSRIQKRKADDDDDYFGEPWKSPFPRISWIATRDRYLDPAFKLFDKPAYRAGGFSVALYYRKSMEAITLSLKELT